MISRPDRQPHNLGDSSGASTAVPWRSPTVRIILASTLLAPLGVPLISPALPVLRDAFGVNDAQASLLISAYFVMGIALSPFIGVLVDRVGRRRVLVPSLLVFSLAGAAVAVAPDFSTVLLIRLVQGTAAAGIFITTITLIGDAFEGVQRNAVLGVNSAALFAGAAVFPVVGGGLVAIAWNAPFLLYLAGVPVALVALRTLEEPPVERKPMSIAYLRGVAGALGKGEAIVPYGAAFLTEVLTFGAVLTTLPFFLAATHGLSPVTIGLVLAAVSVSAVLVSGLNGPLATRLSNAQLIALGFACYGIGLIGVWLASSPIVVGIAVGVFGAGLGLTMPSVDAALSGLVSDKYRGGALSLRNSTTFLGRTTGPVLFAGVAVITGYELLLLGAGIVGVGLAILLLVVARNNVDEALSVENLT